MANEENPDLKQLDVVRAHLTDARKHADGRATDACLHDIIRAVAILEQRERDRTIGEAG